MDARFETIVHATPDAVAEAVAERIVTLSQAPTTIALAGGSTPKRLYERLASEAFRTRVAWSRLELFFGDERAVPPEHPDSNYKMAHDALLSQVDVVAHRMRAETGDAEGYQRLVTERVQGRSSDIPALDLVLLGMGDDGHTASLFPGTAALDEQSRWVVMNEVPQKQTRRMTFTYPLLNAARRVWILTTGADKREMVAACMAARARGEGRSTYPILGVQPTDGELVWWLDKAATG